MVETTALTPVERIAQILVRGDLEVFIGRVGDEAQIEKLQVVLGRDAQKREFVLQVFFVSDITESLDLGISEDGYDSVLLQFFLVLPFAIEESFIDQALRVVNLINRGLPIGHVGVSEPDRAFYFAYQLMLEDREVPTIVLQEVVGLIGFAVASYGGVLEQVARGVMTADQVAQELRDLGLGPTSVGDPLAPLARPGNDNSLNR